jgi:hypothetical protein
MNEMTKMLQRELGLSSDNLPRSGSNSPGLPPPNYGQPPPPFQPGFPPMQPMQSIPQMQQSMPQMQSMQMPSGGPPPNSDAIQRFLYSGQSPQRMPMVRHPSPMGMPGPIPMQPMQAQMAQMAQMPQMPPGMIQQGPINPGTPPPFGNHILSEWL